VALGVALLGLLALFPSEARAGAPVGPAAIVMAGPSCPEAQLVEATESELRKVGAQPMPHARVAAALARVRADRALAAARQLYTRTDFAGCIALLSITEQELGRSLADADASLQRAHALLAQVNLWLGVCQWAAGDPQTAATSFVRSAQLPTRPIPDPRLLPPELVEAHRAAIAAPRQETSCEVEAPLRGEHLLLDGREPVVEGQKFRTLVGTHYLTVRVSCPAASAECSALQRRIGSEGMRSLRLEAGALRCRVQIPSIPAASRVTCAATSEVRSAPVVAALTRESGAALTIVTSVSDGKIALRLQRRGSAEFSRQLVTELEGESPRRALERNLPLVLGAAPPPITRPVRKAWYERWWVWTLVGGAVVGATAASIAAAQSTTREYRIVFRP
jgi:hypothetical protein